MPYDEKQSGRCQFWPLPFDLGLVARAATENEFWGMKLQNFIGTYRALEEKDVSACIFF
jgi:hypothetical protein